MLQPNNHFITRLIDKLPKVVFGSEEFLAITLARQLLVIIHYSGPQFVVDHLLHSPVCFSFHNNLVNLKIIIFFSSFSFFLCVK